MKNASQAGFTLIEMMVGMVVSSIVMVGAYTLWHTHQTEGYRIGKKIELRDAMVLSSKRIQRSITLAGFGLPGGANLAKSDATGSDTLIVFTNPNETKSALAADAVTGGGAMLRVVNPALFTGVSYVVVVTGNSGELRRIISRSADILYLETDFASNHPMLTSSAFPAMRERFYTNQATNRLMRESGGNTISVAASVKDFQVIFRNSLGNITTVPADVRTVQYSFTGIFPAEAGALNSVQFSSTAIPRNLL
ncbi:MAG: prepilin-type N-terminal cleavage/methylation domain-containing protein [Fibrobacteria bacterium]